MAQIQPAIYVLTITDMAAKMRRFIEISAIQKDKLDSNHFANSLSHDYDKR
jgi:hypothetical protein